MSYAIKQGDTMPPIQGRLSDANGQPIDLSEAEEVRIRIARRPGATPIVDARASVESGPGGAIRYDWHQGETDAPGSYLVEITITWDGETMTIPGSGYGMITISPRLEAP